jgi:hypothetical protein
MHFPSTQRSPRLQHSVPHCGPNPAQPGLGTHDDGLASIGCVQYTRLHRDSPFLHVQSLHSSCHVCPFAKWTPCR